MECRSVNRRIFTALFFVTLPPECWASESAPAADGCASFAWDVSSELALMRQPAHAVIARAAASDALPVLLPGRHYSVSLAPQESVRFAAQPARPAREAAPRGGLLTFAVETAGRYRVSITSRHWIDAIADGKPIDSADHQGRPGCELLHKVVVFELPARTPITLQLSGRADREIGLAITRMPGDANLSPRGSPSAG
jgi:hypothetical protein